jgi:hypothetical protein
MAMSQVFCVSLRLCASVLIVPAVFAQPTPKLDSISREWIQRGTTVEFTFVGTNLSAVNRFIFDGEPGLSATNVPGPAPAKPAITVESSGGGISRAEAPAARDEKRLMARVTAAADAPLGPREVRVVTPSGVSNPLVINVGHLPEVAEKAPNGSIEEAQKIELPAAITGAIGGAAQTDHYAFKAAKGQELIFDVDASRRGSALDSSLVISDKSGKELARNEDYTGLDSRLGFTVPEDGEYVLQLRDFRYQGGPNYGYRLYAGELPYVESTFPLGGQRGKTVEISLAGRNLDGTKKMTLNVASDAPRGRQEIRFAAPKGYSNLIPFDVSEHPDFTETETNDASANEVTAPVVVNGRIGVEKDVDRFKFKSDKDQKLVCEVQAYRFGSPLDALLILEDAKGAVLQQNDDAAAADARIEFDAKKDAEYVLSLRDLTSRGGENFPYRLTIRPPSASDAGFVVRFTPDAPRVNRGGHTRIRCEVTRSGGFDGPVRMSFEDLPTGVISDPLVISPAPSSGLILISATKDAPLGAFPIKLIGTGTAGGQQVTRTAEPMVADKPVRQAYLTVIEQAPFTVEAATLAAEIEQNGVARIEVFSQRRDGFSGEIKLTAEGFSAGKDPITKSFTVSEGLIKSGESMHRVKLTAKQDSEVGTRTIVIRGEATIDGAPVVQYSRPVPITVTQIPFVISSTLSRLIVTALPTNAQSAASETATTIKLDRRAGFTNDVELSLEGLPKGVIVTLDKIPAAAAETTMKLVATQEAPPGTNTLTVVAAGLHGDRNYKNRSGPITLTINAPEAGETAPPPPAAAALTTAPAVAK